MSFRFEFEKKSNAWIGSMVEGSVSFYTFWHRTPGSKPRPTVSLNLHGDANAERKRFLQVNGVSLDDIKPPPTFDHFQKLFITIGRNECIWRLENDGWLPVPENFCDEFWTESLFLRIAKAIKRQSVKKIRRGEVNRFLRFHWKSDGLYKLDRYELAKVVNERCGLNPRNWKPGTVWQIAYRDLDLESKRERGPKPKF